MTQSTNSSQNFPLTPPPSDDMEGKLPTLGGLWAKVWSHPRVVLLCVLLGLVAGIYMAKTPRRYTSTATLRLQPSNGSALALSASQVLNGGSANDEKINSELTIMEGRTILLKVAGDLHLADNPDFWGKKTFRHVSLDEPKGRDLIAVRMQQILLYVRQPRSDIVTISCTTSSPTLSAEIANTVTNEYIARIFQVRYGSTERVSTWLSTQLNSLRDQVESDQEKLVGLQDKLGVIGLDQKDSTYLLADSLQAITKASSEATINRIVAEAKLRVLSDSDPNLIEGEQPPLQGAQAQQPGLLQTLRASQAQAAANYASLSARFGSNYPDVQQAKAQLDEVNRAVKTEQDRILNQAKASYNAAASNEQMTSSALNQLQSKAFASHDNMVQYVVLERKYEADRVLYESLMQRLRVAGINAGLESAQVDVVDPADISSTAKRPLPYQWFLFCVLAGLIFGVILAIFVDMQDSRVRNPAEAERILNLPLLATLHQFQGSIKPGSFDELISGAYAEGQQLLRSSVLMSKADSPPNSVLVTSALPGEGKSTVSRGLAAMLAMHNSRVLLIDADLHRPAQAIALGLKPMRGLSDVLTSAIRPSEVIVPIPSVPGLFLLPAGRVPPQPATLLSSGKMQDVVEQMKAEFDFVVIDSPPVLRVSDSVLLVTLVEAVVVVARENMADTNSIKHMITLLRRGRGNVIGFVVNGATARGSGYGANYEQYGNYGSAEPGSKA